MPWGVKMNLVESNSHRRQAVSRKDEFGFFEQIMEEIAEEKKSRKVKKQPLASLVGNRVELSGTIAKIIFSNDDSHYFVAVVQPQGQVGFSEKSVRISGTSAGFSVHEGGVFLFRGQIIRDPKYGVQIKADHVEPSFPDDEESFIHYLSQTIDGIGQAKAKLLVDRLGVAGTIEAFDEYPERIIEVLGESALVRTALQSWASLREGFLVCSQLMKYGLGPKMASRVWDILGEKTLSILEQNPYLLIDKVPGIGFHKADRIALMKGFPPDGELRRCALIKYVVEEMTFEKGHTVFPRNVVIEKAKDLIGDTLDSTLIEKTIDDLVERKELISFDDGMSLSDVKTYYAELGIARSIKRIVEFHEENDFDEIDEERLKTYIHDFERTKSVRFDERQLDALLMALKEPVSIITGGPGVGKTTIIRCLIDVLNRMNRKSVSILLAAPTGRAAKRMSESTGHDAMTIHRAVGWVPGAPPAHNKEKPLPHGVVIVDEVSMTDVFTANVLLSAIRSHSKVVFVGDPDQLPSVGPGMVLKDLIDSRVLPYTRLDRIHRQGEGSAIIRASRSINHGEMPHYGKTLDAEFVFLNVSKNKTNMNFEETNDAESLVTTIMMDEVLPELERQGFDPLNDVQILSPIKKGQAGVTSISEMMQKKYNGRNYSADQCILLDSGFRLKPNDKVIMTKNDYENDVFNGDMGVYLGKKGTECIFKFDDKYVSMTSNEAAGMVLPGYAMTVHKSQGSEYPVVVLALTNASFMLLERQMLFTAVTRGKSKVIVVGEESAFRRAIENTRGRSRMTLLADRLKDLFGVTEYSMAAKQVEPSYMPLPGERSISL